MTSRGFIYQQITKLSCCQTLNCPERERNILQTNKGSSQSHRIFMGFTLSMSFQKEKHSMQHNISNIFLNQFLCCAQNLAGIVLSFMQTMSSLIGLGGLKYFVTKIHSESSNILRTLQIWHHHTFIYSGIWSIVWRKVPILRKKHFFSAFTQFWVDLTDHFGGRVQELDKQIDLGRHTRRSLLLSLK
jgi:hypothetical protein